MLKIDATLTLTQTQTFPVNGPVEEGMSNSYGIWRGVKILTLEKEIYIEPHCQFPGLLIPLKQESAFLQTKYPPTPSQYIGNCIVFPSKYSPTYKIDHLEIIGVRAIGFGGRVGRGDGWGGWVGCCVGVLVVEMGGWVAEKGEWVFWARWMGGVGFCFKMINLRLIDNFNTICRHTMPYSWNYSLSLVPLSFEFSSKWFQWIHLNWNPQPVVWETKMLQHR